MNVSSSAVLTQPGHGVGTDRSAARHRRLFAQLPDNVWILAAAQSAIARTPMWSSEAFEVKTLKMYPAFPDGMLHHSLSQ